MKLKDIIRVGILILPAPVIAETAETPNVTRSIEIPVSPNFAWDGLGQFCSLTTWQDQVYSCEVTQKTDGIYRTVVMNDDTAYVERLVFYSDADTAFAYTMLSGPAAVRNYTARLDVDPAKGGTAKVTLSAWYDVKEGNDPADVEQFLSALFDNGLSGMEAALAVRN